MRKSKVKTTESRFKENSQSQHLKLCRKQKQDLSALASIFFHKFNDELKLQTGRSYFKPPKIEDQYRILRIRFWMMKYKVSLPFIVEHVIKYWVNKNKYRQKNQYGIGISIATITGGISEQILLKSIQRAFPNMENMDEWKNKMQNRIAEVEVSKIQATDTTDFLQQYSQKVQQKQRRSDWDLYSKKFTRRHYRGNPWL